MDQTDVRRWLAIPIGLAATGGLGVVLVALVGLSLAEYGFAIGLLLALAGGPVGLAAAYPISRLLRGRTGRAYVARVSAVWAAYAVLVTLLIGGELFVDLTGPRAAGYSGTLSTGFAQSFGLIFWFVLPHISAGARLIDGFDRRRIGVALVLHLGGQAVAALILVGALLYVFRSSTG